MSDKERLKYMQESQKTYDTCLTEVKKNGWQLHYVPLHMRTIEMCLEAIKQEPDALQFVPEHLKSYTSVRNCNDCHKLCRCEFSTCWTCHKTDICDDCIYVQNWDYREELCTKCNEEYNKNEKEKKRAFQEEYKKREAEHRKNYPHLFSNSACGRVEQK